MTEGAVGDRTTGDVAAVEGRAPARTMRAAGVLRGDSRATSVVRRGGLLRRSVESLYLWPMVLLLGFTILVPTVLAVVGSFRDWNPGYESPFVGLENYREVLDSRVFREIVGNTIVLALGVPLWVVVPLIVAVLLHERVPFPGVFRTIFFFPAVLSPVIIGLMFRGLLRPDGSVNATLESVGLDALAKPWISDPDWVKPVFVLIVLWYSLGFGVLLYSAALSAVPQEQVEAAMLDGANWWQRIRYVILPAIAPTFLINTIFSAATVFLLFGYVYVLTQGGPGYASTTIDFDIYQNAMNFGYYGYAAAESVLLLVTMTVVVGGVALVGRRWFRES
jgi:ABC-type sugar transport system permease subunit